MAIFADLWFWSRARCAEGQHRSCADRGVLDSFFARYLNLDRLKQVVITRAYRAPEVNSLSRYLYVRHGHFFMNYFSNFRLTLFFHFFISIILLDLQLLFSVNSRAGLPVAFELWLQSWYLVTGVLYFMYYHFQSLCYFTQNCLACRCILGEILGRKTVFPGKDCKIVFERSVLC